MKLSPHFTSAEFTRSQTAARLGIPNEPDQRQWDLLQDICLDVLEPAREVVGPITVSSGYRSPALNARLKGATLSDHMIREDACAADVTAGDLGDLFRCLYWLPWSRLIWEFGEWVHVSYQLGDLPKDREPLTALTVPDGEGRKTIYRPMSFNEIYQLGRA